ncbi:MAG: response regulator transcription factor [Clostridia bacterium]|nr:response regulator transcription factor [Clostridia bacterium]
MKKILIAEDNVELSDIMRNFLLKDGKTVYQAFDGVEALNIAKNMKPDLVLLDIMMPKKDGFEVCRELRKYASFPIIIVSAKASEDDKIKMFDLGADDYITKPFSNKEMVYRVNAQLRRYFEYNKNSLQAERQYGELFISSTYMQAKVGGEVLPLTAKEFKLLDFLTKNENCLFGKQKLIDEVWGLEEYIDENTVAVTVARLREKLEAKGVNHIVTVWGLGYKWQY